MLVSANLSRTLILGNGGSGKSWLAERLARNLDLRAFDLDEIHWLPGGFNERRNPEDARAAVRAVAEADKWIVEGVYGWLASEAIHKATAVVFLDIPDEECVKNVRARGLRRGGNEASHLKLIDWIRAYKTRQNANSFLAHSCIFDSFAGPKAKLVCRADLVELVAATTPNQ
jgi:adenylate kinase family enzyme